MDEPESAPPARLPEGSRVVIVGNGVAGMEAAMTLRERRADLRITIVSEESDHFFSRTALMWVACGQMGMAQIEPLERDAYARLDLERVRARATGLAPAAKTLALASGESLAYDRLLIACGSRARSGPWPGSDLDGVGHFVTLQDLAWLSDEIHGGPGPHGLPERPDAHHDVSAPDSPYAPRIALATKRARTAERVGVIGGGLIGIEAVEVAIAAGKEVHFFIREEWFWPLALDANESRWIAERMREHGVHVHLEHEVERIEGNEGAIEKVVTDHGAFPVDMLVIAIGVVPNTGWLPEGALDDTRGAIVVDPYQRTSAEGVFAAGDCAAVRWFDGGQRPQQLWYTSREQGRVAARAMLGENARYARGTWYNSAKLFDIEYTTAGLVNMRVPDEQNFYFEEAGAVRSTNRITLSGDRVVGFNFLGRRWDHEVLIRFIEERRSLGYVLDHLDEARFDTEFVPKLKIPRAARKAPLSGPAPSILRAESPAPTW